MVDSRNNKVFGYSNNFFEANDIIKIVAGLWRPGKDQPLWLRLLYFFYVGFMYFNGSVYFVCQYLIFDEMLKDIPKLLSWFGMVLSLTLGLVKLGIFVFGQKKVDKIIANLQHDDFKYASLDENGPGQMFLEEKRASRRVTFLVIIDMQQYFIKL